MPRGVYERTEQHRRIASEGLKRAWAEGRYADRESSMRGRCGPNHSRWKGDRIGYSGAHVRLTQARGRASDHACVGCGCSAAEWALNKAFDPEALREEEVGGFVVLYSLDPAAYDPLCVSCHRTRDSEVT